MPDPWRIPERVLVAVVGAGAAVAVLTGALHLLASALHR